MEQREQRQRGGLEMTLPWPPSINGYWRSFRGRQILSKAGRDYRTEVANQVLVQCSARHYTECLKVTITAYRPDNRRRDLDNILKAALDGLAHAGVYDDDSQIVELTVRWGSTIGGYLKVEVSCADDPRTAAGSKARSQDDPE